MNKFFKSRMVRSMVPYLIFAVILMILWRVTTELEFFFDAVGQFWRILTPFLTGAIIAYIFNLPCTALQKLIQKVTAPFLDNDNRALGAISRFVTRKSRAFSVLLLIIITVLIIVLILNIVIPAINSSITLFRDEFDNYQATIEGWLENLYQLEVPSVIADYIDEDAIFTAVREWVTDIDLGDVASSIISGLITGLGGFATTLFQVFLSIVSSIYLLIEKDKFKAFVIKLLAALTAVTTNETILKYSRQLDHNFKRYIVAQTIDGLILGTLMAILLFIFGSPYFLVLGLILGIVNYIPYFGSIFGTALAALVIALTQGLPTAAVASIFMFALQQLDGNFIQPKLMGKTFSLSPLLVIISVTIGMQYGRGLGGSIFGMLIAIPIVAILKDMLDSYIEYRKMRKEKPPSIDDDDFMNKDIWRG